MSKRWTIEDLKKKGIRVSGHQVSPAAMVVAATAENTKHQPAAFALGRMKSGAMNKTEAAYSRYLEVLKHAGEVVWYEFEPMNLRLGHKCFYAVDFLVMVKSGQLECREVKGHWTDDAIVKIKTAAAKFPFRFVAVRMVKGEWEEREF